MRWASVESESPSSLVSDITSLAGQVWTKFTEWLEGIDGSNRASQACVVAKSDLLDVINFYGREKLEFIIRNPETREEYTFNDKAGYDEAITKVNELIETYGREIVISELRDRTNFHGFSTISEGSDRNDPDQRVAYELDKLVKRIGTEMVLVASADDKYLRDSGVLGSVRNALEPIYNGLSNKVRGSSLVGTIKHHLTTEDLMILTAVDAAVTAAERNGTKTAEDDKRFVLAVYNHSVDKTLTEVVTNICEARSKGSLGR